MDISMDYKDDLTVFVHDTPKKVLKALAEKAERRSVDDRGYVCRCTIKVGNVEITFFS